MHAKLLIKVTLLVFLVIADGGTGLDRSHGPLVSMCMGGKLFEAYSKSVSHPCFHVPLYSSVKNNQG